MKSSIFISRELNANSVFLKNLEPSQYTIYGESLLKFTPTPFSSIPPVDWIFFYSKNGVQFFFQQWNKNLIKNLKFAALGKRTAEVLKQYVDTVHFIGNGKPNETATDFLIVAKNKHVLFPRAKQSRKSVQLLLKKDILVEDLIVYDNQVKPALNKKLGDYDILVFTSPLNVEAYFKLKKYKQEQSIIAIGNTTAKALRDKGIMQINIAKEASEAGLAEAVKKISEKS